MWRPCRRKSAQRYLGPPSKRFRFVRSSRSATRGSPWPQYLEVHGLDSIEALFAVLIPKGEGREEQGLRDLVGDVDNIVAYFWYTFRRAFNSVDLLDEPAPTGLVIPARARGPVAVVGEDVVRVGDEGLRASAREAWPDISSANRAIG